MSHFPESDQEPQRMMEKRGLLPGNKDYSHNQGIFPTPEVSKMDWFPIVPSNGIVILLLISFLMLGIPDGSNWSLEFAGLQNTKSFKCTQYRDYVLTGRLDVVSGYDIWLSLLIKGRWVSVVCVWEGEWAKYLMTRIAAVSHMLLVKLDHSKTQSLFKYFFTLHTENSPLCSFSLYLKSLWASSWSCLILIDG